jgi:uncharacterized protein YwqG
MTGFVSEVVAFRQRLEAAGLGGFADSLVQMARPSVRLAADPALPTAEPAASRLGGAPDLPASISWPRNEDGPLSFIAQVNLADVAAYEPEGVLPSDGLLSFFYDAVTQSAWGFDPADHGSAAIIYTPARIVTDHRVPPADLAEDGVFQALGLRPQAELTFAPWESFDVESLGMSRDEGFAYADLFDSEDATIHRLLGHPDPVQGDMQVECQLVTNGLYCGDSTGYQDPRAKELRGGAAEWRLLLQIDSQDEAGMMWGDVGRIYYWIKHADLLRRDWDLSWLVLQCG